MVTIDPVQAGAAALAELSAFLRVENAAEDDLLARLLATSLELCESFIGQMSVARGFAELLPARSGWSRLSVAPVRSIEGVEHAPAQGDGAAVPASAYAIDIDARGDGWVRMTQPVDGARILVRGEAGLADDWGAVPEALRHGVIRLAAHLYTHRDATEDAGPPAVVSALWRPYRRIRLS